VRCTLFRKVGALTSFAACFHTFLFCLYFAIKAVWLFSVWLGSNNKKYCVISRGNQGYPKVEATFSLRTSLIP